MVYTGVGVIDARLWRWPFLWEWVGDVPQWRSVSQWHKNYVFVSSQWLLVCRMSLNRRRLQCHSAPFSIIQHFPGLRWEESTGSIDFDVWRCVPFHQNIQNCNSFGCGSCLGFTWNHHSNELRSFRHIFRLYYLFFLSANGFVMVCSQKYADTWQYFCVAFSECSRLF